MGIKSLYTDVKDKVIKQHILARNLSAIHKLRIDRKAYKKFSSKWQKVNLDSFISKFGSKKDIFNMETGSRKISFFSQGKEYEIVCAIGASYFRIKSKEYFDANGTKHGGSYVGIDLKEPNTGKLKGSEARSERNRLTHFRMTYKATGEK